MDLKAKVVELLEAQKKWQSTERDKSKRNHEMADVNYWAGYHEGSSDAYDECQNSLIHVIEEIKKL